MMFVLHRPLFEIERRTDIVMRTEDEARAFASEEVLKGLDFFGRCFLIGGEVVESEHHHRVGVGKDAFVDREFLSGLIHTLIDRDRLARGLADHALKTHEG